MVNQCFTNNRFLSTISNGGKTWCQVARAATDPLVLRILWESLILLIDALLIICGVLNSNVSLFYTFRSKMLEQQKTNEKRTKPVLREGGFAYYNVAVFNTVLLCDFSDDMVCSIIILKVCIF